MSRTPIERDSEIHVQADDIRRCDRTIVQCHALVVELHVESKKGFELLTEGFASIKTIKQRLYI